MQTEISKLDFVKQLALQINDDLTQPWDNLPCVEWNGSKRTGYGKINVKVRRGKWYRWGYSATKAVLQAEAQARDTRTHKETSDSRMAQGERSSHPEGNHQG